MNIKANLAVYRRTDNRLEGLSDDSPRALELHNRRKDALHAVFDKDPEIRVTNWGETDDTQSHELVEIVLGAASTAVFQYAVVPGLKWLGKKLAEKAVDTALSEMAKAIVAKLRPKQQAKEILDFSITLPDGSRIDIDPPDHDATITVSFSNGTVESVKYSTISGSEAL